MTIANEERRALYIKLWCAFLKQLPFKFFDVHWDYVNCIVRKVWRKITVYELNRFYFFSM